MNFVDGAIEGGEFVRDGHRLACPGLPDDPSAVIGIRPEDLKVSEPGQGWLDGTIYSLELTGDETIVNVEAGGTNLISRMDKEFELAMGAPVSVEILNNRAYFFDARSGDRLRPA
ncbi:MAG: TOBE domain-containing protein [Rhodospirillales bacterium]|nr:TOBE domain-containing protein [Rhodospirillales bacterium]